MSCLNSRHCRAPLDGTKHLLGVLFLSLFSLSLCAQPKLEPPIVPSLVYFDDDGVAAVLRQIAQNDPYYASALESTKRNADAHLSFAPDPVVNKTKVPPSGNKHDYLSIGPYWWPDTSQLDGLPWLRRDGEVNPQTRGNHTDKLRLSRMFDAVRHLSWAYLYTNEPTYSSKVIDILKVWFVDTATLVNPNVDFGQGVPGRSEGRPFGIIEWRGIADIVSAIQILHRKGALPTKTKTALDGWLSSYADWLQQSSLGQREGARPNNHANWYDYQLIGLLIYLDRMDEAKAQAEAAKSSRISAQIMPDGSQPEELKRTKSLSYSTMNLRAMILVGHLARSIGVDLLNYRTSDGRSLRRAAEFLAPYVNSAETWEHQQIAASPDLISFFSLASTVYQERLLPASFNLQQALAPLQRLRYPPVLFLTQK